MEEPGVSSMTLFGPYIIFGLIYLAVLVGLGVLVFRLGLAPVRRELGRVASALERQGGAPRPPTEY